jgi:hypothetical protein
MDAAELANDASSDTSFLRDFAQRDVGRLLTRVWGAFGQHPEILPRAPHQHHLSRRLCGSLDGGRLILRRGLSGMPGVPGAEEHPARGESTNRPWSRHSILGFSAACAGLLPSQHGGNCCFLIEGIRQE